MSTQLTGGLPTEGETTMVQDVMQGAREIEAMLLAGGGPASRFNTREYDVPRPSAWPPEAVKRLRESMGVSQYVFAHVVGVSTVLVQGWEQGKRKPAPVAARLLDTIAGNTAAWLRTARITLPCFPAVGGPATTVDEPVRGKQVRPIASHDSAKPAKRAKRQIHF